MESVAKPRLSCSLPKGESSTRRLPKSLPHRSDILLVCGRYEGFDERVRKYLATDELSIGDYVLAGGEVAAMVVIEAVHAWCLELSGRRNLQPTTRSLQGCCNTPVHKTSALQRTWRSPRSCSPAITPK